MKRRLQTRPAQWFLQNADESARRRFRFLRTCRKALAQPFRPDRVLRFSERFNQSTSPGWPDRAVQAQNSLNRGEKHGIGSVGPTLSISIRRTKSAESLAPHCPSAGPECRYPPNSASCGVPVILRNESQSFCGAMMCCSAVEHRSRRDIPKASMTVDLTLRL